MIAGPRRVGAPWLLLAAGVALLLGGIGYVATRPAPSPAVAGPGPQTPGSAQYADPAACADCHGGIAATYARTGMGRSFSTLTPVAVSAAPASGPLTGTSTSAEFHHPASDRHYTVLARDGRLRQRRHEIGPGSEAINVVETVADVVIGSGNHARTFASRAPDGRLLQLPLTWYAERGGDWAMSPGYDRPAHLDFRRVIDEGCMSCHNGFPRDAPRDDGTGPKFPTLPDGIDCQRCHGPGQAHIDFVTAGDTAAARRAIVNPGRLDRDRQLEVCLQCHLETTSSPLPFQVRRVGKTPRSYVPGTPLSETFLFFDHAPVRDGADPRGDKFEIAGAAYRLAKSACFQSSEMTCLTCHDPHDVPRGEAAVQHYTHACQRCHQTVHASGTPGVAGAGPRATCLDCHMPRRRTDDAVHVVMTDHYIQRIRPARDLTASQQEATSLAEGHYQGEVALYYPRELPATPDSELYLALAQVQQASNLASGIPRLEQAIARQPTAPTEFYYELARAHAKTGNHTEVIRWADAALLRDASFAPALKELAGAATALGEWDRAAAALERAVALRPQDSHALADLGNVQLRQQRVDAAIGTLRRAVAIDGTLPQAHNTLGLAALAAGDTATAEREFLEAIRHQPDLADAHVNLANVLAGRRAYADAAVHFERAIRHDPQAAAAHHGYGLVLALTGQPTRALAALREAARLEPGRPRLHTDLGDVLAGAGRADAAIGEYRLAVQADAADHDAHLGLAELLLRRGRTAEAWPHLQAAATSPDPAIREAAQAHLSARR